VKEGEITLCYIYPLIIINLFFFLTSLAWRCEFFFRAPFFPYPSHHCLLTPVEPGYGVDLFEDDYRLLFPAADLRLDPALRPRPVSSLTSVTLQSTTRLNDVYLESIGFCISILRVLGYSPGIYYLRVEQFLALCELMGFLDVL
jgi:hypothetical protein